MDKASENCDNICTLGMEEMDLTDHQLKPCGRGYQMQQIQLLSLIDDGPGRYEPKLEAKVDIHDVYKKGDLFMQHGQSTDILISRPTEVFAFAPHDVTPNGDWVSRTKDFLFNPPYKIGRIFTSSGSTSGIGWIHAVPFVVTCGHIVNMATANNEDILFQLPDDETVIKLKVLYSRPAIDIHQSYKRDMAFLEMENVVSSNQSIGQLPLGCIPVGKMDWTGKCITAGMLTPISSIAPRETQKMVNNGRVESMSIALMTVNARADEGFSGGPVLNTNMKIIGMVQGGHGVEIKTVKVVPIDDISNTLSILSFMYPNIPPILCPMDIDGSNGF